MSFIRNVHHIIFSTKNREPWILPDIQDSLYGYIGGIIRKRKGALMEIGGMADHVHILVAVHQTTAIATLVRDIKSGSSGWLHEQDHRFRGFSWQKNMRRFL